MVSLMPKNAKKSIRMLKMCIDLRVRVYIIMTKSSILTGVRGTLVQILLAQVSSKPIIAETLEVVDQVNAGCSIETRQG